MFENLKCILMISVDFISNIYIYSDKVNLKNEYDINNEKK